MEYAKGDRVRHPSKKEWGLGEVLEDSLGNHVKIFFVDAGEKTLDTRYVIPEKVSGENASHPGLDKASLKVASKLKTILSASSNKKFSELYNNAPEVVRALIVEVIALVQSNHSGIKVYPTEKPDLRFENSHRVCATIQIRKQAPFIKIDLFDIKGKLPGTSLKFEKTDEDVLKSRVYLSDLSDVSDGAKYINLAISNASNMK